MTTHSPPGIGERISNRYLTLARLGSGGMSSVFLAERLEDGTRVVLKFLDPEPTEDPARAERFLREAKVSLALRHPGAAQMLDLDLDAHRRLYLVLELVEGDDLRELVAREGRLTLADALAIAEQVAEVLVAAHQQGVVHRDIKPDNLRVRRSGTGWTVKVLDFGIAHLMRFQGNRLTAQGMLAGTPRYMAPEQVRDDQLDGRVDQYALGLVLFEMLTGSVAIAGRALADVLSNQVNQAVPRLSSVDAVLPTGAVDAFIARSTAKSRAARFPDMQHWLEALRTLWPEAEQWPPPRPPPARVSTGAPTLDGRERRPELVTEPDRSGVARRSASDTDESTPPSLEPVTEPDRPAVSKLKR